MKKHTVPGVIVFVVLSACLAFGGNPADYDTTFAAPDGYFLTAINPNQYAEDVVCNSAGKIFVAVTAESSEGTSGYRPGIVAVNPDGTVDTNFGSSGLYIVPVDLPAPSANIFYHIAIGLAADGNIYVSFPGEGGSPPSWNFFLVRVLADGSGLDSSFGLFGLAGVAFDMVQGEDHPGDDCPYDLAVQNDGSIVVIGDIERASGSRATSDYDFGIARFTSSGGVDSTFSSDGKEVVYFDVGGSHYDGARAVTITSSGEIVVTGVVETDSGSNIGVTVLTSSGDADVYFGSNDARETYRYYNPVTATYSNQQQAQAIVAIPSGTKSGRFGFTDKIYIGGQSTDPGYVGATKDMAVLCLDGDSSTCAGFGESGWVLVDFSDGSLGGVGDTDDMAYSIMATSDASQLVVVGSASETTNYFPYNAVARLSRSDGSLDTSFGENGQRCYTGEGPELASSTHGVLDHADRLIVATYAKNYTSNYEDVWVARIGQGSVIFSDGFEGGNWSNWSNSAP